MSGSSLTNCAIAGIFSLVTKITERSLRGSSSNEARSLASRFTVNFHVFQVCSHILRTHCENNASKKSTEDFLQHDLEQHPLDDFIHHWCQHRHMIRTRKGSIRLKGERESNHENVFAALCGSPLLLSSCLSAALLNARTEGYFCKRSRDFFLYMTSVVSLYITRSIAFRLTTL